MHKAVFWRNLRARALKLFQRLQRVERKTWGLLLAGYLLLLFLFGDRGVLHLFLLKSRLSALEEKQQQLEEQKKMWELRIFDNASHNDLLELTAREKLELSFPSETVYLAP